MREFQHFSVRVICRCPPELHPAAVPAHLQAVEYFRLDAASARR